MTEPEFVNEPEPDIRLLATWYNIGPGVASDSEGHREPAVGFRVKGIDIDTGDDVYIEVFLVAGDASMDIARWIHDATIKALSPNN